MWPQQTPSNRFILPLLTLCMFMHSSCGKRDASSSTTTKQLELESNRPQESDSRSMALKASATKGKLETVDLIASINDEIKTHNEYAGLPDLVSLVITSRLESSISRRIAQSLKSKSIDADTAAEFARQIGVPPLIAADLAKALNIKLDSTRAKLVLDSTNRYTTFRALFESLPEQPADSDMDKMRSATVDEWALSGKFPYLTLTTITQSRVDLTALTALIAYHQRGGELGLPSPQIELEFKRLIPEHFGHDVFPEVSGWRLSKLTPRDIVKLLAETNAE